MLKHIVLNAILGKKAEIVYNPNILIQSLFLYLWINPRHMALSFQLTFYFIFIVFVKVVWTKQKN